MTRRRERRVSHPRARKKGSLFIRRSHRRRLSPQDFGLTIDIQSLITKIDTDGSGEIEYDEFRTLLS